MPEDQETKATASLTPFAPGNTQLSTSGAVIASPPRLFLVSDITRMATASRKGAAGRCRGVPRTTAVARIHSHTQKDVLVWTPSSCGPDLGGRRGLWDDVCVFLQAENYKTEATQKETPMRSEMLTKTVPRASC